VVGAGAIGCVLAAALGKQGRRVLVLERDLREPDRIVGELIQPGGIEILKKLGLETVLDGIDAVKEKGYCVVNKGQIVHLPYPEGFYGSSFHHGRLIMNLRKAAAATPKYVCFVSFRAPLIRDACSVEVRQGTATDLVEESGAVVGVKYTSGGVVSQVLAPLTFVVDGCFSRFRSQLGGPQPVATSSFVGLVLKMPVENMIYPAHGHVVLADPSPVLFYALTPTEIRVLVDVPHPLPSAGDGSLRRHMLQHVLPQLPAEFREAFRRAVDEDRLRSMPNNMMSAKQTRRPGVVLLGDSLNMRHPLTGGGMTVGWSDASLLTDALRGADVRSHAAVAKAVHAFEKKRAPAASTINILSMALYHVFSGSGGASVPGRVLCCVVLTGLPPALP
jgi:squalene monooxygenase